MTIGNVTMSMFGWFALLMETVCITLKDSYLWKDHMRYRHGIYRKMGYAVLMAVYLLAEISQQYGKLTGNNGLAILFALMIVFVVYFLTENGLELMGRILLYWLVCYTPWLIVESLTPLPAMAEGSISYYETPGRVMPNIVILLVAFAMMQFIWKHRFLHFIPAKFCVGLILFSYASEYIRLSGFNGKNHVALTDLKKIAFILIGCTLLVIFLCLFYSIRQRQKTKIAETCRRQFYEQISKIQHEAGKFRHDLANHMQVISRYRQEEQKSRQYQQKLRQRKAELETVRYSGNKQMDFILEQIRQLALTRGCALEIQWEADKKGKLQNEIMKKEPGNKQITEAEITDLTDHCLETVASRSFWWALQRNFGRKSVCKLIFYRQDGRIQYRMVDGK